MKKTIRWVIAITLFLLIYLPGQIPPLSLKIVAIGVLGGISLFLQFLVLGQTSTKSLQRQSVVLMGLTVVVMGVMFLMK